MDQDEDDDPKHLDPVWSAGGRSVTVPSQPTEEMTCTVPHTGVGFGVGAGGRISHVRVLLCRAWVSRPSYGSLRYGVSIVEQCVSISRRHVYQGGYRSCLPTGGGVVVAFSGGPGAVAEPGHDLLDDRALL